MALGYCLCIVVNIPKETTVAEYISPNKRYKAEYIRRREGGFILNDYVFYVKVYETKPYKQIFTHHIHKSDTPDSWNEILWTADAMISNDSDFWCADESLDSIKIDKGKTVFQFKHGSIAQ